MQVIAAPFVSFYSELTAVNVLRAKQEARARYVVQLEAERAAAKADCTRKRNIFGGFGAFAGLGNFVGSICDSHQDSVFRTKIREFSQQ